MADQKWVNGTASTDEYAYKYDRDSNVIEKDNVAAGHSMGLDEYYTYDGLNRLTNVDRGSSTSFFQSFNYDAIGNVTSSTGSGGYTHTVNSQNEITVAPGATPTYDNDGNVTTDDLGNTLTYDAWNRLVAVYNSAGTLLKSYTYDGRGRLATETYINSGFTFTTDNFYYSGSQMIEEYVGTTILERDYYSPVYTNGIIRRDIDTDNNGSLDQTLYFTQDANYNVTAAINGSGTVQKRMIYDSYGNISFRTSAWASSSNTLKLNNLYQGGWQDLSTGYTHLGARWYSVTMRWLSVDPIQDGINWYEPDGDNPINYTDPSGLKLHYFNDRPGMDWTRLPFATQQADARSFLASYGAMITAQAKKHCVPRRLLAVILMGEDLDVPIDNAIGDQLGLGADVGLGQLKISDITNNGLIDWGIFERENSGQMISDEQDFYNAMQGGYTSFAHDAVRIYLLSDEGNIASAAMWLRRQLNYLEKAEIAGTISPEFAGSIGYALHGENADYTACKECSKTLEYMPSKKLTKTVAAMWDEGSGIVKAGPYQRVMPEIDDTLYDVMATDAWWK